MSKDLQFCLLLDFYGGLLTDRQYDIMNLYYNEDFSLAEIADDIGISRQGVRDAVKKSEQLLVSFDEKLDLTGRFKRFKGAVSDIKNQLEPFAKSSDIKNILAKLDLIEF